MMNGCIVQHNHHNNIIYGVSSIKQYGLIVLCVWHIVIIWLIVFSIVIHQNGANNMEIA